MTYEQAWIAVGLIGQFMFTGRFVVQWLSSERNKKVTIPTAFWILSIGGSLLLLTYAIHQRDLVFTIGQSSGLFIYLRNLQLSLREAREKSSSSQPQLEDAQSSDVTPALAMQQKAA
jgi:lipid-A-disaccharide synthase-like uncharacterized protein